jgi:cysteinyl-tRNA synthetase
MPLEIHDSLTDRRIPLPARTPGETSLYVCGPTVYGYIHVGNARPPVVFDVLARHLRAKGKVVKYIRNFTDIDDKIIQVALAGGEDPRAVAERFIAAYREDMSTLCCEAPTAEPRVSEHLAEIVAHIEALLSKGNAYVTDEGDVYYDVASFEGYGKLSKRDVAVNRGEFGRGKSGGGKRNEHDFALWKRAKPEEPAGARWPSPWGEGRPGWHIECSAMSHAHIGAGFDVHGGGMDLKFPHHENEIAQSEAVYGAPMAGGWMHNGFIEVDIERGAEFAPEVQALLPTLFAEDRDLRKISKSDRVKLEALRALPAPDARERALLAVYARKVQFAEWFQLRRLLTRVDGEAVRYWILGTHYRAPLGFDLVEQSGSTGFPTLEAAEKRVEYFYETRARVAAKRAQVAAAKPGAAKSMHEGAFAKLVAALDEALDDDLNTAGAMDPMGRVYLLANKVCDEKRPPLADLDAAEAAMARVARITGVAEGDPEAFFARVTARRISERGITAAHVDGLIAQREAARGERDFARADALREALTALRIEVRDGASGTTWRAV